MTTNPYKDPDDDMRQKIERVSKRANQPYEVTAAVLIASFDEYLHEIEQCLGLRE